MGVLRQVSPCLQLWRKSAAMIGATQCSDFQKKEKKKMLRLRLEYACITCGRPFGRGYSARRHLGNVHDGQGEIVSFMDYMLGVQTGHYPPPSYHARKINPRSTKDKDSASKDPVENVQDMMDRLARFSRNVREVKSFFYEEAAVRAANPPPEFVIGYACGKCLERGWRFIQYLDPSAQLHQCDPEKVQKYQSLENRGEVTQKMCSDMHIAMKSHLDHWMIGEKYLQAFLISQEAEQAMPKYLNRLKINQLDIVFGNYLGRAIVGSMNVDDGWATLMDHEVLDFLQKARATVAIVEVQYERTGSRKYYLVRIAPPHVVGARKQKKEIQELMSQFGFNQGSAKNEEQEQAHENDFRS